MCMKSESYNFGKLYSCKLVSSGNKNQEYVARNVSKSFLKVFPFLFDTKMKQDIEQLCGKLSQCASLGKSYTSLVS